MVAVRHTNSYSFFYDSFFETEGERVYFFEPLEEEMSVTELQELMNEHEKFILEMIQNMRKEKK